MFRNRLLFLSLGALLLSASAFAQDDPSDESTTPNGPVVRLETSLGNITVALDQENAPLSTANFIEYVKAGFYTDTQFHRVIDGFMIQGGGFDLELSKKATRDPIKNEADNGLSNKRGTIAMARTNVPDSATAQFYINSVDNSQMLDHTGKSANGWGYAVFGVVTEGMEVVDAISGVETGVKNGMRDVPKETVVLKQAVVVE